MHSKGRGRNAETPPEQGFRGVSEGTRTPDRLDHNQELYQLSYAHQGWPESSTARGARRPAPGRMI